MKGRTVEQRENNRLSMTMQIRLIRLDECDVLGQITLRAYLNLDRREFLGPYEKELLDVAARRLDSEVYVAVDDAGTLIGGVTYVPGPERAMSGFQDPEAAGIRMLAVDPQHQGLGAGRALVETCIARARLQHRRRIILHSTHLMTIAQDMYKRLGFESSPELDIWFADDPYSPSDPLHLIAYTLSL
jgi:ribosomal protein S18 acetylase RimI-like enzyme